MKRELLSVLIGASILLPADAMAQRNRTSDRNRNERDRTERVQPAPVRNGRVQPAPVRANGRIAYPVRSPRHAAASRTRVVYTNRGVSARYSNRGGIWIQADWGRRIPVRPIFRGRRDELNQGELRDILGKRTVDRVKDAGRHAGLRGGLRGHWVNAHEDGLILVVTMDRVDVAEFVDFDRDGFIDDAFVIDGRRGRLVASRW
jgi:hypothetical protein